MLEVMDRADLADRRLTRCRTPGCDPGDRAGGRRQPQPAGPARQGLAAHRLPAGPRGRRTGATRSRVSERRPRPISDELLVVLVGDMVTEEALPSYSIALNGLVRDEEGDQPGSLGTMAARLDGRGKPARRPAQRLPPSHRPRAHARRGTDRPRPHRQWLQPQSAGRSLQPARLHLVPGARHAHLARQRRPDGRPGTATPNLRGSAA